jgi:N-acetylglucosamine kinase-like BadF-type ATPase
VRYPRRTSEDIQEELKSYSPITSVGVDLGGTWIRVSGVNKNGRRIHYVKHPAVRLPKLRAFLKKTLLAWRCEPAYLAVGSRGIWKISERQKVSRSLLGLAPRLSVISDVEAAWLAAFSPPHPIPLPGEREKGEGIVVISGTGSIAYGRRTNKKAVRAGGYGPGDSDEGSGFWIGNRWLINHAKSRPKTVRETAQMAGVVLEKALRRDPLAQSIIREAQAELAELALRVARRLKWTGVIPVAEHGSVLRHPPFARGFRAALRRLSPTGIQWKVVHPRADAATALARSIMRHASC